MEKLSIGYGVMATWAQRCALTFGCVLPFIISASGKDGLWENAEAAQRNSSSRLSLSAPGFCFLASIPIIVASESSCIVQGIWASVQRMLLTGRWSPAVYASVGSLETYTPVCLFFRQTHIRTKCCVSSSPPTHLSLQWVWVWKDSGTGSGMTDPRPSRWQCQLWLTS